MSVEIDVDVVNFTGTLSKVTTASDGSVVIQSGSQSSGESAVFVLGTDGSLGTTTDPIPSVAASKMSCSTAPASASDVVNKAALDAAIAGVSSSAPAPTTPAVSDSGWVAPTMIGTWVNNGNTALQNQAPAGYRKIGNRVQLRGLIKNPNATGAISANLFRLPAGFYPGRQVILLANNYDKPVSIKIQTDGYVYVIAADPTWLSLDNVSFLVD